MSDVQPVPFSREAEEALIGALIVNPLNLDLVDLDPADFYIAKCRWIYEIISLLRERRITPDFVTVTDELQKVGRLTEVGGGAYIAQLIAETPSSLHAEHYAEIVRDKARRRRAIQVASQLAKAAYNDGDDLDAVSGQVLDALALGIKPRQGARLFGEIAAELYDEIEYRAQNPADIWGLETGFIDFDRTTGGLQAGEVIYICGEPGVGKSILSMQMGLQMAQAGHPGVIYSLEMRDVQVARRMISAIAKVETRHLKSGRLEGDDWTQLTHAVEIAYDLPLFICDESDLTTLQLRADLARLKRSSNIEWFVLDYLFLMGDSDGKLDDTARTALLSRRIKSIAKDLELAGITVNSVVKEGMDTTKVSKRAMRGSGQVIHDADLIGFLLEHIPDERAPAINGEPNPNLRTFLFTKGREIEQLGFFHLTKFKNYPAFGNYAPEKKEVRLVRQFDV